MFTFRNALLVCFLAQTAAVPMASAEKVNLTPEQLRKVATHIMVGEVTSIYQRTETRGSWRYTEYVAEMRVRECEKGNGINQGELAYMRYWRRAWIGKGNVPPSTSGHRGLPSDGDLIRVYTARNAYDGFTRDNSDGGLNVIGANGFEKLKPSADR